MTKLTKEQLKEKKDQVARSMSRAGIGKYYHTRSLSDYGEIGSGLIKQLDEPGFKYNLLKGSGFFIEGTTDQAYELSFVLAKALRLMKIDARVIRPLALLKYFNHEGDADVLGDVFEDFDRAEIIFVPRLFDAALGCPFTKREIYQLEEFFVQSVESGLAVGVHFAGDTANQNWYSKYAVKKLKDKSIKVRA
jgi:hypothetical protein